MAGAAGKIGVYLESGRKRVFAAALDWPGWCRSGNSEQAALEGLLAYAGRYAHLLSGTHLGFAAPSGVADLVVTERLAGNATTDFGAPDAVPSGDLQPLSTAGLRQSTAILEACWQEFDRIAAAAAGKELRKGPRGGGREAVEIAAHVTGAEEAYLSRLGWKLETKDRGEAAMVRQAVLQALAAAAPLAGPRSGPRGGRLWTARYAVRRLAWHVLDHAWEIEDRILPG